MQSFDLTYGQDRVVACPLGPFELQYCKLLLSDTQKCRAVHLSAQHDCGWTLVGAQATAYAWLPDSLYIGCSNGQIALLDTAAALKQRQRAQRPHQGSRFSVSAVTAANAPASAGLAIFSMVGALEFSGQAVQVEALATNKDCIVVAGHCPVIRQGISDAAAAASNQLVSANQLLS